MNVKPGGKASRCLRTATWGGEVQAMNFTEGSTVLFPFTMTVTDEDGSKRKEYFRPGDVVRGSDARTRHLNGACLPVPLTGASL